MKESGSKQILRRCFILFIIWIDQFKYSVGVILFFSKSENGWQNKYNTSLVLCIVNADKEDIMIPIGDIKNNGWYIDLEWYER